MYIVIELQMSAEGGMTHLETIHNSKAEAESKFYSIMAYAAVSEVPVHSATVLNEKGEPVMYKSYTHEAHKPEPSEE